MVLSCESIHAVQMRCRSSNGKNHEHGKYECLIPFIQYIRGMASGGITEFFLHHGAIHAAGAGPPQWKMGVVCIRATFLVCFVFRLHWTLINSSRMNDNYEKWTQVVWGCDRHHAQNLVLWYCVTKAPPLAPSMGSIAINRCSCKKSAWASFDSFGAMTFLLRNQKKKKKKS